MGEIIFNIVGGLALFLYGLHILSGGFKKFAGSRLKKVLKKLTTNPWKGAGLGAFFTMLVQSSSITIVTLIGLLSAGLVNLTQAIGVMIGAEVGTTVTAQIVSFKVGLYALPAIAIGFALYFFAKRKGIICVGQVLLGFGILFLGMQFMGEGIRPLGEMEFFGNMLAVFSNYSLLAVLAGMLFTIVVMSSSATTAIVIAMGLEGIIILPAAIAIMAGANLGTCITGFLASINSSLSAKRLALAQFFKNAIGVFILLPFLGQYSQLMEMTAGTLARQIANAHTVFNVVLALLLIPLILPFERVVKKIWPGMEVKVEKGAKYLSEHTLHTPSLAILQAQKEIVRMAEIAENMLKEVRKLLFNGNENLKRKVIKEEEIVDELHHHIDNYLAKIYLLDLSEEDSQKLAILTHSVTDIERVADHADNLAHLTDLRHKRGVIFSKEAKLELEEMFKKSQQSFSAAKKALQNDDIDLAREVLKIEKQVNALDDKLQENHHKRTKEGTCDPASGPIYLEIVHNLERVSDHSENIASGIITGF